METDIKKLRSCSNCSHYVLCRFKPDVYMGDYSGGFLPIQGCSYERFSELIFEVYGRNCSHFIWGKQ